MCFSPLQVCTRAHSHTETCIRNVKDVHEFPGESVNIQITGFNTRDDHSLVWNSERISCSEASVLCSTTLITGLCGIERLVTRMQSWDREIWKKFLNLSSDILRSANNRSPYVRWHSSTCCPSHNDFYILTKFTCFPFNFDSALDNYTQDQQLILTFADVYCGLLHF